MRRNQSPASVRRTSDKDLCLTLASTAATLRGQGRRSRWTRPPFPSPVGTNPSSAQVRFTTLPKTVGNFLNTLNKDEPIKFPSIRALDHSACIIGHPRRAVDDDAAHDELRIRPPIEEPTACEESDRLCGREVPGMPSEIFPDRDLLPRLHLGGRAASDCESWSGGGWRLPRPDPSAVIWAGGSRLSKPSLERFHDLRSSRSASSPLPSSASLRDVDFSLDERPACSACHPRSVRLPGRLLVGARPRVPNAASSGALELRATCSAGLACEPLTAPPRRTSNLPCESVPDPRPRREPRLRPSGAAASTSGAVRGCPRVRGVVQRGVSPAAWPGSVILPPPLAASTSVAQLRSTPRSTNSSPRAYASGSGSSSSN